MSFTNPRPLAGGRAVAFAGIVLVGSTSLSAATLVAAPSASAAAAAGPVNGAHILVANGDSSTGRVDVFDGKGTRLPGTVTNSTYTEQGQAASGNVLGDDRPEVLTVAGFGTVAGFVTVFDAATGLPVPNSGFTTSYREGDGFGVGDVNGDGTDEVLVVDREEGGVEVYDVRAKAGLPGFGINDSTFDNDGGNGFAIADVDGDDRAEVLIANKSGGRIDVLDPDRSHPFVKPGFGIGDTTFNDDSENEMAAADVDGDRRAEVFVANFSGGRVDVLDPDKTHPFVKAGFGIGDTTFNNSGENQMKAADVDGDGRAEVLIANGGGPAGDVGRIDILDPNKETGPVKELFGFRGSGFGARDVMVVSTFTGGDLDRDGIPDKVELKGIRDPQTGALVLDLKARGASPCRKDIVVEIDWMVAKNTAGTVLHDHRPVEDPPNSGTFPALEHVKTALAAGPVTAETPCPYPGAGTDKGINLIPIVDDAIDEVLVVDIEKVSGNLSGFDQVKNANFDTRLDPYVRYNLWLHDFQEDNVVQTTSAGLASPSKGVPDDQDFLLTTHAGTESPGDIVDQETTFMHELGHVIGLLHGGDSSINCKPNYYSLMNYTYSATGVIGGDGVGRLEFSDEDDQETLKETDLDERVGVGGDDHTALWTAASGATGTAVATGALDWSGDDKDTNGTDDDDHPVKADLNRLIQVTLPTGTGTVDCRQTDDAGTPIEDAKEELTPFDDWKALSEDLDPFPFSAQRDPSLRATDEELSVPERETLKAVWDQALNPQVSELLAPPRPGFFGVVAAVTVDGPNVYATHQYRTVTNPSTSDKPGTLMVKDRTTMATKAVVTLGFGPRSLVVDPVAKRLYALSGSATNTPGKTLLTVVDTTTFAVVGRLEMTTAQATADVALNPKTGRLYIASSSQDRILVVNTKTLTEAAPILVGPGPVALAVDVQTSRIFVAQTKRVPNGVQLAAMGIVVDNGVSKPSILPHVDLGDPLFQPSDVTYDSSSGQAYVSGLGAAGGPHPGVAVVDTKTRTQIVRVDTRGPARSLAANPDTALVFAAGDRGVDVVNVAELRVTRQMDSGVELSAATGSGSSRQLFTGGAVDGTLQRLSYSSGTPK